jgi:hypothetical protein
LATMDAPMDHGGIKAVLRRIWPPRRHYWQGEVPQQFWPPGGYRRILEDPGDVIAVPLVILVTGGGEGGTAGPWNNCRNAPGDFDHQGGANGSVGDVKAVSFNGHQWDTCGPRRHFKTCFSLTGRATSGCCAQTVCWALVLCWRMTRPRRSASSGGGMSFTLCLQHTKPWLPPSRMMSLMLGQGT